MYWQIHVEVGHRHNRNVWNQVSLTTETKSQSNGLSGHLIIRVTHDKYIVSAFLSIDLYTKQQLHNVRAFVQVVFYICTISHKNIPWRSAFYINNVFSWEVSVVFLLIITRKGLSATVLSSNSFQVAGITNYPGPKTMQEIGFRYWIRL